jgi:hypothetical protein
MARFLGEGIDQSVANQIEARGRIMSRSPRNESDLKYLNQRTGWVRVTSMVNVGDSSEEAKELILQGGTVRLSGDSLALRRIFRSSLQYYRCHRYKTYARHHRI